MQQQLAGVPGDVRALLDPTLRELAAKLGGVKPAAPVMSSNGAWCCGGSTTVAAAAGPDGRGSGGAASAYDDSAVREKLGQV